MIRYTRSVAAVAVLAAILAGSTLATVSAAEADFFRTSLVEEAAPAATSSAWYWEPQFSQPITDPTTGADVTVLELPNPWCPVLQVVGPPPSNCYPGRLPIEVHAGDYETPDKISAVAFDLSLVPLGSDVKSFTVDFKEADPTENQPSFNHENKELLACPISDFFGDGAARQYKERPKHECPKDAPVGTRKEAQEGFVWRFDLTDLARTWVEQGAPITGMLIYPNPPKEPDPAPVDFWRVVLAGPEVEDGIVTSLRYKSAPVDEQGGTDPGFGDTDSFGGSDDFGGSSPPDFGTPSDTGADDTGGAQDPATDPEPETTPPVALDDGSEATGAVADPQSLPWYAWFALLAGLFLFSVVRSVVIEKTTGIRPDGVISQIRRINSGSPAVAAAEGPSGPIAGLAALGRGLGRRMKLIKR